MIEQKKIRLHQVASELNVSKDTIVLYLNKQGFEIQNKPTSIVSNEMIEALLKGFIKEKKVAENFRNKFLQDTSAEVATAKQTITTATKEILQDEFTFKEETVVTDKTTIRQIEESLDFIEEVKVEKEIKETKIEPQTSEPKVGEVIDLNRFETKRKKEEVKEKKPTKKDETQLKKTQEIPPPKVKPEKKVIEQKKEPPKVEEPKEKKPAEVTPKVEEKKKVIGVHPTVKPTEEAKPKEIVATKEELKPKEEAPAKKEEKIKKAEPIRKKEEKKLKKLEGVEIQLAEPTIEKVEVTTEEPQEEEIEVVDRFKHIDLHEDEEEIVPIVKDKWLRKRGGKQKLEKYKPLLDKKIQKKKIYRDFIKESEQEIEKNIRETLHSTQEISDIRKRAKIRHKRKEEKLEKVHQIQEELEKQKKIIQTTEFITTGELAKLVGVDPAEIIQKCFQLGLIVSLNQRLDKDTITLIALDYGYEVEFIEEKEIHLKDLDFEDPEETLQPRPPIVTIMGHVDHGKTSLLDYIRKSNIVAGEAGGITQHIGAYQVEIPGKGFITFIDTPGHEAFTAMRARGAMVTDIVVLVVAADDAVMPQTIEAINHAKAANVPIIVAINKVDKPDANPDRIRQQLSEVGILVEDWQGPYQCVEISAKFGTNVDLLLEKILLEAELLNLRANPNRPAKATIVESHLDRGKGPIATAIIQKGTLKIGDIFVVGLTYGRVRAMFDEREKRLEKAGPSTPVRIVGFDDLPEAGDILYVVESEQVAKEIASKRQQVRREQNLRREKVITLDDLSKQIQLGQIKELNLILKTDVMGSLEALTDALSKLSNEEVKVNILHRGVGNVNESDVTLAAASNAVIIAFQVSTTGGARKLAEKHSVEIRRYEIIYDCLNDVKLAVEGLLSPDIKEVVTGTLEVRKTFKISKVGTVAGCYVKSGKINRNDNVRVIRDGLVIHTGTISSLKRGKDDVREVDQGYECGIMIEKFNDIQEGDIIEAFKTLEIKRTLNN
ncbi:translation initiation factor IF-2 [Bacteroidetes/Chlorobi group bacterium Naka2016]|jgi:translation initiation factor IF-2|nr:MAG: translation initiation factor IF-2 [Bacteroidetes/Chlorobi group bacterium Naka2016]